MSTGEMLSLCCQEQEMIVAAGEIQKRERWIEKHVADIRFGVLPGHEKSAAVLLDRLMSWAKKCGVEVLLYYHLRSQRRGILLIRELGFCQAGTIPRYYKNGKKYIDRIVLCKTEMSL